ncbi:MAG: hypothetical protein AB1626_03670 [Candidatus Micrarchaeota archaeon]
MKEAHAFSIVRAVAAILLLAAIIFVLVAALLLAVLAPRPRLLYLTEARGKRF